MEKADKAQRDAPYEEHLRMQRRDIAQNTTAEQRLHWLEETLVTLWENGLLRSKLARDQSRPSEKNDRT